ncbi:MAG: hypothetical protein KKG25_00465 [Bacteroidetes bacterium]|nr:hypothetical protein [Bacteroidota bacterium]
MLALKSAESTNRYHSLLQEASASNASRSILYDFIHQPELFVADLETHKHSKDEPDNGLFESNNAFGINLDEILGSEWREEKAKKQPEEVKEEKITNTFGIDLNEILGSEFQKEKPIEEENQDLEIEAKEVIENEVQVQDNSSEDIVKEPIPEEAEEQLAEEQKLEVIDKESEATEESETEPLNEQTEVTSEAEIQQEEIREETNSEEDHSKTEDSENETFTEDEIKVENIESISEDSLAETNHSTIEEVEEQTLQDVENEASSEEKYTEKQTIEQIEEQEEEDAIEEIVNDEVSNEEEVSEEESIESESILKEDSVEKIEAKQDEEIEEEPVLNKVETGVFSEEEVSEEEKPIEIAKKTEEPAEELVFESPVHSDFLTFVDKDESKNIEEQKEEVTAYNDDSMPYTFLWWLNKTRKEYAESHQPYLKAKSSSVKLDTQQEIKKQEKDDLNHQIAENIFHLRGVEEFTGNGSRTPTVPFEFMRKDFQIIEKFIKEEPQIRPLAPNKIDTENKAKKSSEDSNEVVSETLAKIYVEQMLYHKALDVYKKLSLKFPEKSAYFASQIKYLELKVN